MKKLLFTTYDLNLNGAALSLVNFLSLLDYDKYQATVLVMKEKEKEIREKMPKEVKIIYLYKDNPFFDIGFFKGLNKIAREKRWNFLYPLIVNSLFKNINTKNIKKLKIATRRVYVPDCEYDVGICFDEQSYKYLRSVRAKKKIVRYAYGEVVSMEDPNNKPYNFCDYVIAQCEGLKEDLAKKNKADREKIVVIHNIFDNDKILEKAKEPVSLPNAKYIFSTCGRIVPIKRMELIPYAIEVLLQKGLRDFKWLIIGAPEKERFFTPLKNAIEETGTGDYIELLGAKENPYPYIKGSDIYVQCSNVDAWPRSVMEALILGVPVLATATRGAAEQIEEGVNGYLSPLDDPVALGEKLFFMAENAEEIKNRQPLFRVDNEAIMKAYYKLFDQLV